MAAQSESDNAGGWIQQREAVKGLFDMKDGCSFLKKTKKHHLNKKRKEKPCTEIAKTGGFSYSFLIVPDL